MAILSDENIQKASDIVSGIAGVVDKGLAIFSKVKETVGPTSPTTPAAPLVEENAMVQSAAPETTTSLPVLGTDNKMLFILIAVAAGVLILTRR